jgi:hypothetical protein
MLYCSILLHFPLNHGQFSVLRANTCQFYRFTFTILKLLRIGRRTDRDWVVLRTLHYPIQYIESLRTLLHLVWRMSHYPNQDNESFGNIITSGVENLILPNSRYRVIEEHYLHLVWRILPYPFKDTDSLKEYYYICRGGFYTTQLSIPSHWVTLLHRVWRILHYPLQDTESLRNTITSGVEDVKLPKSRYLIIE